MLSQTNKVSKFCMDARFLSVVEIGQYFMTKDNGEQLYAMTCREYTLPRNDGSSQPKGWIQGHTKIGPVLEVTTSCLYGKHGVEIRIWSLSEDNTHSWHGSNKFVMDSNNNDTEVPEDQTEEQALQLNVKDFACRSKAKAKPQRREPAGYSPSIIPMNERNWIYIVKSISPIQENSMQYGYDENDNNNMSGETKCETNYSINNWWNKTRNKHLTKHDTNVLAKKFGIGQWSFICAGSERSGILVKRIVHKELGIISRTKCCWKSQKADILFSVQRLHCPGVFSIAKDMENCQYTSLQIIKQLKLFFALFFLSISSVFTEQLRTYVRNLKLIKIDQGNLMY